MIEHLSRIPAVCPLSESQMGVYLECINDPMSLMYNIVVLCRLPEGTDANRIADAVRTAAAMHPAFHVHFGTPGGVPSMILSDEPIKVTVRDIDDITAESLAFAEPFDLENGPLYRFDVCRDPAGRLYLLFDVHHSIFDGTSIAVFVSEIARAYDGGELTPETLTIFDVATDEQKPRDEAKYAEAAAFFREKLSAYESDSKPASDIILPDELPTEGLVSRSTAGRISTADVAAFVKAHGITENAFFHGAFAVAMAKFSGTNDASFSAAYHGRSDKRLFTASGMFVKTLPVYYTVDDSAKVSDFLAGVHDTFYKTKQSVIVPYGVLAETYGIRNDVAFNYQDRMFDAVEMSCGKIDISLPPVPGIPVDLDMMVNKDGDAYTVTPHFRCSTYTAQLMDRFAKCYINVAAGMLSAETIGDIPLTDADDRALLDSFNATDVPYDKSKTVVDLFREQAKKTPDNDCVVYAGRRYSYREADDITDRLAAYLVKQGVGREKVVGVLIPRCEYMMLCSMGVLKAGGAYLPLDPTYPPERLNLMMQDSGAMMLLYAPEFADVITPDFTGDRMSIADIPHLPSCDIVLPTPEPHDRFVMLYTSGSTGTPKGVMFEHANALVTTEWVKKYFAIDETSRLTAYASYGFDAHAFDMYPAITSGAALHVIGEDIRLDFPALKAYFNENGITHTVMTTQVGRQFAGMKGLKTLRHISVAGEKLTPLDPPDGFVLYNLYGPTEGSIVTSAFRMDRRYKDVPIGKPVDNLKMYVVGKSGQLLPAGAVGELWIAGPHVTRGYLNRPEKTAEAYGENPFEKTPGYERVYRTGDIVRIIGDGNLQFVGRRDAQVKVRGFRIELTEIEEVIRRFPGIKDVTVAAFDDPSGGKFVAAYVVSDSPVDTAALGDFIRAEKPPYMVPAVTMQIDKIPLTQNQKVNKRALPVPERSVGEIVPPENDTQKKIFDIVADIVGHRDFGILTSIYEAGLTSIGAVRLNVALADCFAVPIRLSDIKANDTVKKLEAFLAGSSAEQFERLDDYPISETQSGIFVECMAAPDTTVYNIPVLVRLGEGVVPAHLAAAVEKVLDVHPYVKTQLFTDAGGNVRAKRLDADKIDVPVIRCEKLPEKTMLVRPHTLLGAPLCRAAVYETSDGNYLFMDYHHLICDGTSEAILFRDIDRAYAGETLIPETFSGFEAALAEQNARAGERYEKAKAYWNGLLNGCDTGCLPKKEPESPAGGAGFVKTVSGTPSAVEAFCEKNALSVNGFFNAVFSFVLSRFTGKESVSYATIYNGRSDSRLANAVTMLVKTMPVVADIDEKAEILPFVRKIGAQLIESMSNDICSFAELSASYGVNADVIFIYQGADFVFDKLCGEPAVMEDIAPVTAKAPISINVYKTGESYTYTAEYRKDVFSAAFAEAMLDAIDAAAASFLAADHIGAVTMMTARAEDAYARLNESQKPFENTTLHALFERCAAATPDAPAVTSAGKTLSYGELNTAANKIAHALVECGVKSESIVGIILDRSCEIPMAQFGILKAGGAFLAILPSYPDDRIEYCLRDAESPAVITTEAIKASRPALFAADKPYRTLTVEELMRRADEGKPNVTVSPEQLAYSIYTSGSTGNPKGVMIEHRNIVNCILANYELLRYYTENARGASLGICSVSFDASVLDIFLPLCSGKHFVMCTEEEQHNPLDLLRIMTDNDVQMMVGTPSVMANLLSIPEFVPAIERLKTIVVGAEAFPGALYEGLRKASHDLQIINGYGPSECAVCSTVKELESANGITIGRSVTNFTHYVMDVSGHVLPPYAIGELIICGAGVGRGYVKLPEKTAASFFTVDGMRAYHSGDMVRLNADGELDFGGRKDNQVKLRGFRVELDEIEKVMSTYPSVQQVKVIVRNNGSEDYLAGFFTASKTVDLDDLTAHMKSRLTYYMVPSALMQLEKMPMTQNGKIDKKALPEVTQKPTERKGRRAAKKSLEQRLCEIFANILGKDEVYADDNFFELGGTSLTASKVTMVLMSDGIEVKYGDIFDNPTPEELAEFIEQRDKAAAKPAEETEKTTTGTHPALAHNKVKFTPEVKREPLGNVLLTGAVGFLGVHVLNELLSIEKGHIYCLVRRGSYDTPEIRLKTMLIYYFSNGFEEELRDRITVIEADITDDTLEDVLADVPFDTVINCAACVKHFSDSDILERINVRGVENLIGVCQRRGARLVQISTVSVPGIHTKESYEQQIKMHEDEIFVIDDMANKYAISKYHAELRILDAIRDGGLRGKIVRVGNLMGRQSDGEFQVNFETNMFLSGIRGFAVMGKYPISHMTDPMSFSPVDCTARAVVLLAGTNDEFTAFNANNRYSFDEMKIIDACNRCGITILPEQDERYYEEFQQKLGDDKVNSRLTGLAAYDIKDAHAVETDNLFTTNILYRIGFSWPLVDDSYLDRAITSIMTLDYFDTADEDENGDAE